MKLIRIAKGERRVILEGDRRRLQRRLVELRKSTRNGVSGRGGKSYNIQYLIEE